MNNLYDQMMYDPVVQQALLLGGRGIGQHPPIVATNVISTTRSTCENLR